jgi:hypothetical protein
MFTHAWIAPPPLPDALSPSPASPISQARCLAWSASSSIERSAQFALRAAKNRSGEPGCQFAGIAQGVARIALLPINTPKENSSVATMWESLVYINLDPLWCRWIRGQRACADTQETALDKNEDMLNLTLCFTEKIRGFRYLALLFIKIILEKRTWSVVYTLTPSLAKCEATPKSV